MYNYLIIEGSVSLSGEPIRVSVNTEDSVEVVSTHRIKHGCSYYMVILKKVGHKVIPDKCKHPVR